MLSSHNSGGLGIGSLRGHNLALLGKWWWRFKTVGDTLWVRVIKSIYGCEGGLSIRGNERNRVRTIWGDIIKTGAVLEKLGIEWGSAFQKKVGNGLSTYFWKECWIGSSSFENRFPRLFRLERMKDARISERGRVVNNMVSWVWDWIRPLRGRALSELEELLRITQNVSLCADKEDAWRWTKDKNGEFSVGSLRKIVDDKILVAQTLSSSSRTLWNNLTPKKVCIFIWRALKDRLPVRVALADRGLDLNSTLCPRCGNEPESLMHCLIMCPHASNIWTEIFAWWGLSGSGASSVIDLLLHNGHSRFSADVGKVWQAVIWITSYHIWNSRNDWLFRKKPICDRMLPLIIKTCAFNWISRRCKRGILRWREWNIDPVSAAGMILPY